MTTRLFFFVSCKVKIVNNVSQKVTGAVRALPDWTDRSRWAYVPLRLPSAVLESGPHWATVLLTEDSLWRPRWREADVLLGGQPTTSGRGATTAGRKIHAPAWKLTALFVHIVNTPPNTSHPTHLFSLYFFKYFFFCKHAPRNRLSHRCWERLHHGVPRQRAGEHSGCLHILSVVCWLSVQFLQPCLK